MKLILMSLLILLSSIQSVSAQGFQYSAEETCEAIRQAENSYSHPYGIMRDYCKPGDPDGQCRKGCIQTVNKRLGLWNKVDDFITYLGSSYCPPDAHPLNKHWVGNVKFFLKK